jgi:hypothetical protein
MVTVPAQAFTLAEDQALDFGRFIVVSNSFATSVTLSTNGNINSNGDILVYRDAQAGAYSITGAPPLAALTITVTPDPLDLTIVNNRFFRVDTFTISNSTTDSDGNLTFTIGATITSDGAGTYNSAMYTGNYIVSVTNP